MYKICIIAVSLVLISCGNKTSVTHELKFSKEADGCDAVSAAFRMISNIGGERYEFSKCLSVTFESSQVKVSRSGDTVIVRFPSPQGQASAAYAITLDIDSYPRYNFLTVDDETITLTHSEK